MQTWQIALLIVAVCVAAAAAWFFLDTRRSRHLRTHFGPEYERTLNDIGDRRRAEAELARREAQVRNLDIRPLSVTDRDRFQTEWKVVQTHFVDDPVRAVDEADHLIVGLMQLRGYPTDNPTERIDHISAAYPRVVGKYREACEILTAYRAGQASTEDLRRAMVHYRNLFDELMGGHHEELQRAS
jgi:hypothetical protein